MWRFLLFKFLLRQSIIKKFKSNNKEQKPSNFCWMYQTKKNERRGASNKIKLKENDNFVLYLSVDKPHLLFYYYYLHVINSNSLTKYRENNKTKMNFRLLFHSDID